MLIFTKKQPNKTCYAQGYFPARPKYVVPKFFEKSKNKEIAARINTQKRSYADVLKNPSVVLNPGMHPQPLICKTQRVRLSEYIAKKNLHAAIQGQPMVKNDEPVTPVMKAAGGD